jgi:hypothetical protein
MEHGVLAKTDEAGSVDGENGSGHIEEAKVHAVGVFNTEGR